MFTTAESKLLYPACIRQTDLVGAFVSNAVPPGYYGAPSLTPYFGSFNEEPVKIAGTGFAPPPGVGAFWTCRNSSRQLAGNNVSSFQVIGVCGDNNQFPDVCPGGGGFGGNLNLNILEKLEFFRELGYNFLNHENLIRILTVGSLQTSPFADIPFMATQTIAARETAFRNSFVLQCRRVYTEIGGSFGASNEISIYLGAFQNTDIADPRAKNDCTGVSTVSSGGSEFTCDFSDCRFQPISFNPPRFDNCLPFQGPIGSLDAISSKLRSMAVIYFNDGPLDLLRDNTDARCNTFVPIPDNYVPPPPPPPPGTTGTTGLVVSTGTTGLVVSTGSTTGTTGLAMSPDVFIGGLQDGGNGRYFNGEKRESFQGRKLLQLGNLQQEGAAGINNASHPCFEVYDILVNDSPSRALKYLMEREVVTCVISNVITRALDILSGWDERIKGERLWHPHTFYKSEVGWSTFFNFTRGLAMGLSYNGYVLSEYAYENMSYVPPGATSGNANWEEYAEANGVTDKLSLYYGKIMTALSKLVIAYDFQGRPVPSAFGIVGSFLSINKLIAKKNQNYTSDYNERYNSTGVNGTVSIPVFSEGGWNTIQNLFTFNWMTPIQPINYTATTQQLSKIDALMAFGSSTVNSALITHGMTPYVVSPLLDDPICDPRDRDCFDCELLVLTAEVIVEVVLNCVEDLQNTKRFQLNLSKVDLERSNTFFQPGDKLACENPPPLEDINLVLETLIVVTKLVTFNSFDVEYVIARIRCHLNLRDEFDPHSYEFYVQKSITCDPLVDSSAARGRAGAGLRNAVLYVTLGLAILIFLSATVLPVIPTGWINFRRWLLLVMGVAYFSSPSCFLPVPPIPLYTLPDALADDIYLEIRDLIPKNCTIYHPDVASPECAPDGRTFVDCSKYGFDYGGGRHLAYALAYLDPDLPGNLRGTSIPGLSSILETPYYDTAFTGIKDVFDTPIGDYCFGVKDLSFTRSLPLFVSLVSSILGGSLGLALLVLAVVALAFAGLLLVLYTNVSSAITDFVTRFNADVSRFKIGIEPAVPERSAAGKLNRQRAYYKGVP
jgi:hypothetical protein